MQPLVGPTLADFLDLPSPLAQATGDWVAAPLPSLHGIHDLILNFETNGLDWLNGHRPIGVSVGTLDGQLTQFIPFRFRSGNVEEAAVKAWFTREVRGKNIINGNTRFDVHMSREWGCDLEAQGNTVSDVMHYAALIDDSRKRFALDVLATDLLGGVKVPRIDETRMTDYEAWEAAPRAEYQIQLVRELYLKMWPILDAEDLQRVRKLEDEVIYPTCEMEKNGAKIDLELLDVMQKECVRLHDQLVLEVSTEAGFVFDHTNMTWRRLFEKYGVPLSYLEETKDTLTFADNIVSTVTHPIIQKARRAAQLSSLNSKTFKAYREHADSDGVLHFNINQLRGEHGGTTSGRFSIGYVQQVPNHDNHHAAFGNGLADVCTHGTCHLFPRRLFVPALGDYLAADAAQIEYRIFASYANNPNVLKAYEKDPSLSFHKLMWEAVKQHKPHMLYTHQKSMNFMTMYAGGLIKLAIMMGHITAQEGEEIRKAKAYSTDSRLTATREIKAIYDREMPEVGPLQREATHLAMNYCDDYCYKSSDSRRLHQKLKHRGYVRTVLGRRSRFQHNFKAYRGLNRVIQGSAADVNKQKIVELHRNRNYTGLVLRQTVHDEVCGDAPTPDTKTRVAEVLNAQSFPTLKVPILWDVKTGRNWAECK